MSTAFGYWCDTCAVRSICEANWGNEDLARLYHNSPSILDAQDRLLEQLDWTNPEIEINAYGSPLHGYVISYIDFLRDHRGHQIIIVDEYGRNYPELTLPGAQPAPESMILPHTHTWLYDEAWQHTRRCTACGLRQARANVWENLR